MLVAAGKISDVETIVERAAEAENTAKLEVVRRLARRLCSGEYDGEVKKTKLPEDITVREFGAAWVDGELHRMWPDHVELKRTAADDLWRMRKHVFPIVGHLAVKHVTLDDVDAVMASLPRRLSKASRRHVAQLLVRMFNLSVYPARLRTSSPIPRGWLPKLGKAKKQFPILLPPEDSKLMREPTVPLVRRLTFGILHREGLRRGDVESLRWRQLDLQYGTIRIESDKTDHARMFKLRDDVLHALRRWKSLKGDVHANDLVLTDATGRQPDMDHLAAQLRNDLRRAGVTRRELFEAHGNWGRLNAHSLRHSFVTRSLARGMPEDAVRQRTGHVSNELRRYRELARSIAELDIGDLEPLHEAIPELAGVGHDVGPNSAQVIRCEETPTTGEDDNQPVLH